MSLRFSMVIPVYNRPEEIRELLESLCSSSVPPHEIILVEDGSQLPCEEVAELYKNKLPLRYVHKTNSGPGLSRNVGAAMATGDYLIFVDSDCLIPEGYFSAIETYLETHPVDFFGGPDAGHPSFSPVQQAVSQTMTGFLTTGGIRGGSEKMDKFYPRSFNMGIAAAAFQAVGGFHTMRFGEDVDLSIRLFKAGFTSALIPGAWLYHKRRTHFRPFFKQVYNSGMARILLQRLHPGSLKMVHLLPAIFTIGSFMLIAFAAMWTIAALIPLGIVSLAFFIESAYRKQTLWVSLLSVVSGFIQLWGYGLGFLHAWVGFHLLGKKQFQAFDRSFYR